jgi:hypothetical protein
VVGGKHRLSAALVNARRDAVGDELVLKARARYDRLRLAARECRNARTAALPHVAATTQKQHAVAPRSLPYARKRRRVVSAPRTNPTCTLGTSGLIPDNPAQLSLIRRCAW